MIRRHIWVIEWHINQWEPRHVFGAGTRKDEVLTELRRYKKANPHGQYRLKKYVPER